MTNHEPYEVLCALSATGQLTGPEKANFDDHCMQCSACRRQLQDLSSIGLQLQLEAAIHASPAAMSAGALERFRARAIHEGIMLHSPTARWSPLYALAAAAVVLVILAALISVPTSRKAPERLATSAAAPIPIRQGFSPSVTEPTLTPRYSKAIHAHFVRHRFAPHADMGPNEPRLTTQQFPQVLMANYSFFERESATKPLPTGYPALSRSQMSHLNLFPELNDSGITNGANIGKSNPAIDVASVGKIFDFAANIRQIHFQLPTTQ